MADAPARDETTSAGQTGGESFLAVYRRQYARQVQSFLLARVAVFVVCLFTLLIYEEGRPEIFANGYTTLVLGLAVASVQLAWSRRATNLEFLVTTAIAADLVLEALLAYFTGGIYNLGFAFLFFASILAAVLLLSDGAGIAVASIASVALAGIALVFGLTGKLPGFRPPLVHPEIYQLGDLRWGRAVANLIGATLGFFTVAFLVARLPSRLGRSQVVYEELLERMVEGVVAIDRRGRILLANAEARRLLNWGHRPADLLGRPFEEVLRRREDLQILEVLGRGVDALVELELDLRGRDATAVEARTTVLRDSNGRVRGVVGIFRDLTLRRQLEAMEARLARLADVEAMALGIAHEVRNPLGSVRGAIQELAERALTDPSDRRLAQIVREESGRIDRIIQQFLDFARMRPPIRQRLDLWQLVDETAELLRRRPDAAEVTVEVGPRPAEGRFVRADPDQLRQALLNVGINGLEAMGGRGRLRFQLAPALLPQRRRQGKTADLAEVAGVALDIENDGPPLGPEAQRGLFTPFFTTKRGGLGLGMAITQKIVREHDGDVECLASELGGPRFRIVLPSEPGAPPSA